MSRLLSSDFTYFYKVIVPALALIALVGAGVMLGLGRGSLTVSPVFLPLGVVIVGVAGYQIRVCVALKRVEMDARNLYVSNYRTQIVVPLRDVADVTENRWLHLHPVTIHFQRPTEFGSSIVFAPDMFDTWFSFLSHPVVKELRQAVAHAKGLSADEGAA
jgi:hypothetical protein